MSILVPEEAEPSTPASGKAEIYVTVGAPGQLTVKHEDGSTVDLEAGAGGGETNTASNIGTDGVGVFDSKSVADLQFRNIAAVQTEHLGVALDAGDNDIDLTILGAPTVKAIALKGSGGTINAGDIVYVSGWNVGSSVIEVELADSDNASAMPAIGIAEDAITSAASGSVIVQGPVTSNTTGESVNAGVYVDTTAGAWTTTRPTGITTAIQRVGTVIQIGASGTIFVAGALRSNDVPNLEDAKIWLGNVSNVATAVDLSGDATIDNAGAVTVDHDTITNYVAAEHVDWAAGAAGTIHTDNYIEGGDGTDGTAIHDNVASEISAVTEKGSPAGADMILIEDSAAGNAKKMIQITNLPAGGEINDLASDGINGIADDQLAVGTGANTAAYQTLPNSSLAYNTSTGAFAQATWAQIDKATSDIADITTKSHTSLTDVGSNAHSVIDTHLGAANPHSGSAASGANSDITSITGLSTPLAETQGGTGTATWTAGDLPYSDATNSLAGLAKGTAFQHLRMNAGATAPEWTLDTKSKSITVEDPADGDRLALWMNESALTVLGVSFASLAGTSVLFNLEYAATIASGTVIHTDTCASSTPEWDVTPSGTAAVPTNQIVLLEITTVTGSVTDLVVTVHYRENA